MSAPTNVVLAATTRDEIVEVARDLIQTRSYLGFSFQDIADRVGIRKASLYHHFPSKEALGIEVLHETTQRFLDWTRSKVRSPSESVDAYCRMLRDSLHAGDGVCPTGALAPGWGVINDELRQSVRELRDAHVLWLAAALGGLPSAGRKRNSAIAQRRAAYVFAVCQGALLSSRMTGRVEDFDEAVAQLKSSLQE